MVKKWCLCVNSQRVYQSLALRTICVTNSPVVGRHLLTKSEGSQTMHLLIKSEDSQTGWILWLSVYGRVLWVMLTMIHGLINGVRASDSLQGMNLSINCVGVRSTLWIQGGNSYVHELDKKLIKETALTSFVCLYKLMWHRNTVWIKICSKYTTKIIIWTWFDYYTEQK